MTLPMRIDTLAFSEKLRAAGADEKLAKAIVEGVTEFDLGDLATKTDLKTEIAAVRADLKTEIASVRTVLAETKSELKAEIAAVRADLKAEIIALELRITDTLTRRIGFIVALVAILDIGSRFFGH